MNIEIRRYRYRPETIDGHLFIDGMKVCDTAENALSAIPAGTYPLNVIKCKQHSRKMPILGKVSEAPCTRCIPLSTVSNNSTMPQVCHMICPGNGVYKRTDGTIIVGKYIVPGCLTNPRDAFDNLYQRIRKNAERGNEIFVTIRDCSQSNLNN